MRPAVEIHEVVRIAPISPLLAGAYLDWPKPGEASSLYGVRILGWAIGAQRPVIAVEAWEGERLLLHIPLNLPRPDVAAAFPHQPAALASGFQASLSLLWSARDFSVSVRAVLADGQRAEIAILRGRRRPVQAHTEARLQPLLLTTLGRTGSTWVMRLLAQHPSIASYRPFHFEPRVASYWAEMIKRVAAPESLLQTVFATDLHREDWWLRREAGSPADFARLEPALQECLGGASVDAVADFGAGRIEDFYRRAAQLQGRNNPVFFAEKAMPASARDVLFEIYPRAREIFLVRDPRDMVASILAFNAKRNYQAFGRERYSDDESYVAERLRADTLTLLAAWQRNAASGFLLRYEDVINAPAETLARLLGHLGLPDDPVIIAAMIADAEREIPEFDRHRTSAGPAASLGRWQRDLSPRLQAVCAEAFGEVLQEFGYSGAR